ncbi:MAG TPA: tyrosine-type recombinase/integrase [Acidimicrobiales bacterium]|nr:tyrosine-type recombinase/integrase [Acidimicrobiales bacterium]
MIRVRTTAQGQRRYDVRLRDPAGRVYTRTFRTRDEANNYAAQERVDRARGQWVDPRLSGTTFATWAVQWLDANPNKRPKTRVDDELVIRLHLNPSLGARGLGAITPLHVQRLVSSWVGVAAPATVHRRYAVLRAILNAAVDADVIGRSPCRGVKLPAIEVQPRYVLTVDELTRLAEAIGPDYEAMVYIGAVLGLRIGEVIALRVGRLDLLRGTLKVAESAIEVHGRTVYGAPKSNAGRRTLAMPAPLVAMLAEHLRRRGLTAASRDALVFAGPTGGPVRYSNWQARVWAPATEAAALPGLRFHDLRKLAATSLVSAGVDVRTAQARLGHSDPRLTLIVYAQVTESADRSAARVVGDLLMPSDQGDKETGSDTAR